MSHLLNSVASPAPRVDPRLAGKIFFSASAPIPREVNLSMTAVLKAVADQLEKEKRPFGNTPINCIFSGSDSFAIALNEGQIAICVRIIFYPLPLLCSLSEDQRLMVLTEELCHLIWDIRDETLVDFKVLEVLRNHRPQAALADLYSEAEVLACSRYAQEHPDLPLPPLVPA